MLHTLVVPLDGSPLAEVALPFACALSARTGARLTLVRDAVYRTVLGDVAAEQVRAITASEDYLARTAIGLQDSGVPVSTRLPLHGSRTGSSRRATSCTLT